MTASMAVEGTYLQVETSMKEIMSITRVRGMECINALMDLSMKVLGSKTSTTVKVFRNGLVIHPMKVSINMARGTVMACTGMQTGTHTMETTEITIEKAKECITIQMEQSTQVTISTIRFTARVSSLGRTAVAMRGNMYQVRRRAMESSNCKKSI
jgi:hypothetical protein